MTGLKDKKALVTGAAGGIGRAIVAALQAEGAITAGTDQTECDADYSFTGDLMDKDFCDNLPQLVAQEIGGLDILVNNAGVIARGLITDATDEDLTRSVAINIEAPFRRCERVPKENWWHPSGRTNRHPPRGCRTGSLAGLR